MFTQLMIVKCDQPDRVDMDRGIMAINMCVQQPSL